MIVYESTHWLGMVVRVHGSVVKRIWPRFVVTTAIAAIRRLIGHGECLRVLAAAGVGLDEVALHDEQVRRCDRSAAGHGDAAGNAAPNHFGIHVAAFSHDNTIGSTTRLSMFG